VLGDDLHERLGRTIPSDHSRQVLSEYYIERLATPGARVIDLGCGAGGSVDQFRSVRADVQWLGIDLAWSPEVGRRTRTDAEFATFDGTHIPAADGSVDAGLAQLGVHCMGDAVGGTREGARGTAPGGPGAASGWQPP